MNIEQTVGEQLKHWGFSVEKIPKATEPNEKTPDYQVSDAATYLVEVKSRGDDPVKTEQREDTLNRGEIFAENEALIRKNTISGIIQDACSQLENYGKAGWFRVAWICATGRNQQAKHEQFKAALYGSTRIFDPDRDNHHQPPNFCGHSESFNSDLLFLQLARCTNMIVHAEGRPCYFFGNSEFFNHKETLDAAVVSTLHEAELCLNPHSPKFKEFQKSKLTQKFDGAVCNPVAEEAAGDAYVVDSSVDRDDKEAVMNYLREKYNAPKLSQIDLGWDSATVRVQSDT